MNRLARKSETQGDRQSEILKSGPVKKFVFKDNWEGLRWKKRWLEIHVDHVLYCWEESSGIIDRMQANRISDVEMLGDHSSISVRMQHLSQQATMAVPRGFFRDEANSTDVSTEQKYGGNPTPPGKSFSASFHSFYHSSHNSLATISLWDSVVAQQKQGPEDLRGCFFIRLQVFWRSLNNFRGFIVRASITCALALGTERTCSLRDCTPT